MICAKCQSPNAPAVRFCSNCGAEMGTSTPPAADPNSPDWSASEAFSKFNRKSPKKKSPKKSPSKHDPNPDDDEVTRVAAVRRRQEATVSDDLGSRASGTQIGRTIEGKYRLDAVIGTGGMGSVYRATRLLIGDFVAIKLLHPEHISEAEGSERFRREAQAAARLKHPNAVSIYDFGVTNDGLVYLVMELVEGQSLRRVIKEQGPLNPVVAADIINQICAALDEAHRQQIVHRDLKPDNIIVNAKITGLQVKVLDFGIAKLRDATASNLTQTGSVMGTPHYMSPEQCLGEELDNRSDIYSLGIVLYEMLAGVVPFNSPNSARVVVQHVNDPPPSLRGINLGVLPGAEAAVMHALAKRREHRPQSARAFAAEFSAAVDSSLPPNEGRQAPRSDVAGAPGMDKTVVMTQTPRGSGPNQPYSGAVPSPQPNKWISFMLVGGLLLAVGVIAGLLIDKIRKDKDRETASHVNAPTPSPRNDNARDNSAAGQSSTPERARRLSENIPSPAPPVVQNPPRSSLDSSFQRSYQGTVGKDMGLRLALNRSGSELTGRASTTGSTDTLEGNITPDGSFTLRGYENGGPWKGIYRGRINTDGTITGYWTTEKNEKRRSFFLRQE